MTIYFYSAREEPYGCFSNFSKYGVTIDGVYYKTTEHYFQAMKFEDPERQEEIRAVESPMEAKKLGQRRGCREDWEGVKDEVMLRALQAKFAQHEDLREQLVATGDARLVEDAPRDYYWGIGRRGNGKNMLGELLMRVRGDLVAKAPPG